MAVPAVVLVLSGKRKSGKDAAANLAHGRLGSEVCAVLRLSAPLKEQYAKEHGLDYEELLGAGEYKERYRAAMILWGEERRAHDPGFFCREAVRHATQPVWIVSDARRLSDVEWFRQHYSSVLQTVRVSASEDTRKQRGWEFTPGVDDAESECGLDQGVQWDWLIANDGSEAELEHNLEPLLTLCQSRAEQ
uniref:Phosphomevalonate kinase n=1 Tax=Callorhinchus milii TaxID=7868 RepID=V9L5G1_CALMI